MKKTILGVLAAAMLTAAASADFSNGEETRDNGAQLAEISAKLDNVFQVGLWLFGALVMVPIVVCVKP